MPFNLFSRTCPPTEFKITLECANVIKLPRSLQNWPDFGTARAQGNQTVTCQWSPLILWGSDFTRCRNGFSRALRKDCDILPSTRWNPESLIFERIQTTMHTDFATCEWLLQTVYPQKLKLCCMWMVSDDHVPSEHAEGYILQLSNILTDKNNPSVILSEVSWWKGDLKLLHLITVYLHASATLWSGYFGNAFFFGQKSFFKQVFNQFIASMWTAWCIRLKNKQIVEIPEETRIFTNF